MDLIFEEISDIIVSAKKRKNFSLYWPVTLKMLFPDRAEVEINFYSLYFGKTNDDGEAIILLNGEFGCEPSMVLWRTKVVIEISVNCKRGVIRSKSLASFGPVHSLTLKYSLTPEKLLKTLRKIKRY